MTLLQIQYIKVLEKTRNYSAAANILSITQPTLSEQIKKLERELGVVLFRRSTHNVVPTEAGKAFAEFAVKITDDIEYLERLMRAFSEKAAKDLTIGTTSFRQIPGIKEWIINFTKENPDIKLDVINGYTEELIEKLNRGEIDFAIIKCTENEALCIDENIIKELRNEDRACVIVKGSHELAGRKSVSMKELKDEKIVFDINNEKAAKRVRYLYKREGLDPNFTISMSSNEIETLIDLVENGLGITFMSEEICKNYEGYDISYIPIEPVYAVNTYILQNRKWGISKAGRRFIKYLQSEH